MASIVLSLSIKWLDLRFNQERLRESVATWRNEADWADAVPINTSDYRWLDDVIAGSPQNSLIKVAHALGGAGSQSENTLSAAYQSLSSGLRLLEVDLWLDDSGAVYCHHGPEAPKVAMHEDESTCTMERLLTAADKANAWLVLDIKTDFADTTAAVLRRVMQLDATLGRRLIFQIYRPNDLSTFNIWARRLPLPGPIVTAYASPRSLAHISAQLPRLGVRVLTVPLYRLSALPLMENGRAVLVHPVHDCTAWNHALDAAVTGVYMPSSLNCDKARMP